ncbi:MAG: hypothetical protein AAF208_06610 [Cyanobacteria bacterium P01_A01_bin.45]
MNSPLCDGAVAPARSDRKCESIAIDKYALSADGMILCADVFGIGFWLYWDFFIFNQRI